MSTTLTDAEWTERFKPVQNHLNPGQGILFETYGTDLSHVLQVAKDRPGCVWTLLDADGRCVIGSGYHLVNRLGYHITEVPCPEGETIDVPDEPSDDGEDEESDNEP